MKKLLATISLGFVLMTAAIPFASAAVELDPTLHPEYAPAVVISGGTEADYGNYFLQLIAGGLLYLAGPTAILFIAIAGLRYVTSHGDQNAIEGAKKTLEWAIIGLIVVILSYATVRIVINTVLQTPSAPQTVTAPGSTSTGGDTPSDPGGPGSGDSVTPPPPSPGGDAGGEAPSGPPPSKMV